MLQALIVVGISAFHATVLYTQIYNIIYVTKLSSMR